MSSSEQPAVLVAPLNWGMGHATRSSAIIQGLIQRGVQPVLASSGISLTWLRSRFPELEAHALPDPDMRYARQGSGLLFKMLTQLPAYLSTLKREQEWVLNYCARNTTIRAIISDHRLGVYHPQLPSFLVAHQLKIPLPAGISPFVNYWHKKQLNKFNEVWIPDFPEFPGLSGKMGHGVALKRSRYIGPLVARLPESEETSERLLVLLSGPEPQRTLLEKKLFQLLREESFPVAWVRGTTIASEVTFPEDWLVLDLAQPEQLEPLFASARLVVSRSGYSTLMDLHLHGKPAVFIPTPGQPEQLYLAKLHQNHSHIISVSQDDVTLQHITAAWQLTGQTRRVQRMPLLDEILDSTVARLLSPHV